MNKKLKALLLTVLTLVTPVLVGYTVIEYPMIALVFLVIPIVVLLGYKTYTIFLDQE